MPRLRKYSNEQFDGSRRDWEQHFSLDEIVIRNGLSSKSTLLGWIAVWKLAHSPELHKQVEVKHEVIRLPGAPDPLVPIEMESEGVSENFADAFLANAGREIGRLTLENISLKLRLRGLK